MNNIDKAIMYKEGNTLQKRVEELTKQIKTATKEAKIFIEKDIKKYEYAIKGENKIINTLMNTRRIFTVTGTSDAIRAAATRSAAVFRSCISAEPAPVFTTLGTGQPMFRSITSG